MVYRSNAKQETAEVVLILNAIRVRCLALVLAGAHRACVAKTWTDFYFVET